MSHRILAASAAIAVSLTALAASASAATEPDRVRPQLAGVTFTPRLACRFYTDTDVPIRSVSFTLSEPATVTLHKLSILWGVLPAAYTTGKLKLAAGPHTLNSAYNAYPYDPDGQLTVPTPTAFPFDHEQFSTGRLGLDAVDGAGNRTSVKWSPYLNLGESGSSHGAGTNGCA